MAKNSGAFVGQCRGDNSYGNSITLFGLIFFLSLCYFSMLNPHIPLGFWLSASIILYKLIVRSDYTVLIQLSCWIVIKFFTVSFRVN
jgi:hypothetical protein